MSTTDESASPLPRRLAWICVFGGALGFAGFVDLVRHILLNRRTAAQAERQAARSRVAQDLTDELRDAFAGDLAAPPQMTLRSGDIVDSYGSEARQIPTVEAVTDDYLTRYCQGLPHLDAASWRHYLPALADFALRHLSSGSIVVSSLISSLRPPDRVPPRLGSLTAAQEQAICRLLEILAFSPESTWHGEACQALEEWWVENALYRPSGKRGSAA